MEDVLKNLKEIYQGVENTDPIDFADLPFDEEALRDTALRDVLVRFASLRRDGLSDDEIHTVHLVTTARLVLENLVLHVRLLTAQGREEEIRALDVGQVLAKFRLNSGSN